MFSGAARNLKLNTWMATLIGVLGFLVTSGFSFAAEIDAPFGFKWGQPLHEIQNMNLDVKKNTVQGGRVNIIYISKAPITPSDTDFIGLSVDTQFGLQKIHWFSKNIDDDPYGVDGKKKYNQLKQILKKKYGLGEAFERIGLNLYRDADEFYECLNYAGCGMWSTIWKSGQGGVVMIEIKGSGRRGVGYLLVTYEGPKWSAVVDAVRAGEKMHDEQAF